MKVCECCGVEFEAPPDRPRNRFCGSACAYKSASNKRTPDPTPAQIRKRAAAIKAANLAAMQAKQTTATENDGCDTYRSVPRREIYRHHGRRGVNFWRAAS